MKPVSKVLLWFLYSVSALLCGALVVCLVLLCSTLISWKPAERHTATVNDFHGVSIFLECSPIEPYTALGVANDTTTFTGTGKQLQARIIKVITAAKKQYPDCNGVIFSALDASRATFIKFQ